ncbi:hypothetical protein [Desulfovermiculus halophilus]|jgi:hypothetical protein|uniref:hypothetical protein n=1 Tax=Desulfovermiculus halophilus TaxID=339722 RepID=UPI000483FF4C|nr:hypothetical protein [Desulfovermiculus halophilus]
METWLLAACTIFIIGIAVIVLRFGRPAPENRGQARLASKLDDALSVQTLARLDSGFDVYYAGQAVIPSALLFVPREDTLSWKLRTGSKGWKPVQDQEKLNDLFLRIRREDSAKAYKLWVLLPPSSLTHLAPGYAYLFSPRPLPPQRVADSRNQVSVHPLPEYNSSLYGSR